MPAFVQGTVVTLVLDEFDILTTDGQANLSVTPTGHPTYQTQTIGHQVIGPFGIITTVVLTGAGAGTYVAGPSNQPQHVLIVDISAAQQASPTSDMLAATGTLFQLNTAPYTIYQSTGTALTQIGGGSGVSSFSALTDKATVDLVATNPLLAASLAAAGAPAQSVAYSTVIPLDTPGNGKFMPQTVLNANSVFTVGASPVEQGNCNLGLVGNGTNIPNLSAFVNASNYTFSAVSGANNVLAFGYFYGTPTFWGYLGTPVVVVPGQVVSLTAGSSSGTNQALSWTAGATGGTPTDYLVEYKLHSSGIWLTFSHGVSAATTITVTGLTAGSSYDYRVSGVNSAGTGTASSVLTVSTLAVPGQVTGLTLGVATSSSQAMTWAAPGTGGTPTDYLVEYRTTAGPGTWTTFSHTASTALSQNVTGLSASTSYDYRVSAVNAAGTGTASTTATGSTSSVGHAVLIQSSGTQKIINGASLTFNMPGNYTTGNSIILAIASFKDIASGGTEVQVNDVYATQVAKKQSVAFPNYFVYLYLAQGFTGGTSTIIVSTPSGTYLTASAKEWSGIQSSAFDITANNLGTGTSLTVTSGTTSQANELIYAAASESNAFTGTLTGPSGYTVDLNYAGTDTCPLASGYKQVTATGTQTAVFAETSSNELYGVIATFKTT